MLFIWSQMLFICSNTVFGLCSKKVSIFHIGDMEEQYILVVSWCCQLDSPGFHFFSQKKSEIWMAFTLLEKWKVKNRIRSLFFERWKWNWNCLRSRTRSENENRIFEKSRETRISLVTAMLALSLIVSFSCPAWKKVFLTTPDLKLHYCIGRLS